VVQKFVTIFISLVSTNVDRCDLYNIWHIVYPVNLQHNNIIDLPASPTYCCYTTVGKSQLHSIKFSNQNYTLPLHKIKKFAHTVGVLLSLNK